MAADAKKIQAAMVEVEQATDALNKLAEEATNTEKQTSAQIEKLFGAPTDTRGQFDALKRVVLNLAARVEALEK